LLAADALRIYRATPDEHRYRQYLETPLAAKKLSAINRQTIATIHAEITRAGPPPVANRVHALVSSVFGCVADGVRRDAMPRLESARILKRAAAVSCMRTICRVSAWQFPSNRIKPSTSSCCRS